MTIEEHAAKHRSGLQRLKDRGMIVDFDVTINGGTIICSVQHLPHVTRINLPSNVIGDKL